MSSFINFNNKEVANGASYTAEALKIALLKSETKSTRKAEELTKNIEAPLSLNEALTFFTDKLSAVKSLSQAIAEINEGRVKQFEMDYKDMETSIKRGIGWIDPEYVEDTWENSSDSIDFELVKTELYKRLINAGLLAFSNPEDGETKGVPVRSLKDLNIKESRVSEAYGKSAGLSKEETLEVAQKFADAMSKVDGTKVTVNKRTLEEDSFDLDVDGEEFDGGSYNIYQNGNVMNMALRENPVYGKKNDSVDTIVKNMKKLMTESVIVEKVSVTDERVYGKRGIIIMIDDNGKQVSAIFKDKKNADKYNRNKEADLLTLLDLAKNTKYPNAIDESIINEAYEVHYSDGVRAFKKFGNEGQALAFAKDLIKNKKGLQFVDVFKAGSGFHSTADTDAIVAFWGDGSYTDNVAKGDTKLATKKINEAIFKAKDFDKTLVVYKVDQKAKEIYVVDVNKFLFAKKDPNSTEAPERFNGMFGMMLEDDWSKTFGDLPKVGDILPFKNEKVLESLNEAVKSINEGQFSWMTQDTGNQIGSQRENTITVYMFDDKGNKWKETKYDGYGEFGGKDYYELLAQMNGIENADRQDGIDIAFDKKKVKGKVLFPALVEDPKFNYKKHDFTKEAEHDPNQSWYQEEEYDEYDESVTNEGAKFKNTQDFEAFLEEIDGMGDAQIKKIMGKDYIDTPGYYSEEAEDYDNDIIEFMISNMGRKEFEKLQDYWENNVAESKVNEAKDSVLQDYVETMSQKTFKGGGNGQNLLDEAMGLAGHIDSYTKGRDTRGYEEDGFYEQSTIALFKKLVDSMSADDIKNNQADKYESLDVNEGRSINKIQKEWSETTTKMQQKAGEWKVAEGDRKAELLDEMKALTAKKRALEAELDAAVAGKDRDLELVVSEGNAFGAARAKAIADGAKEFEFEGETYKVEEVGKDDKENAKEFVEESKLTMDSLLELFEERVNEDIRSDVKKFIKDNANELNALADKDEWDLMYAKLYNEFNVEPESTKGKDLLKTFQFVF